MASSVGFTGPEIRGAILMTTRQDLVELAWPARARGTSSRPNATSATGRASS